jgi:hypothetical protein
MHDLEIESLLFKQVEKPKHFLTLKIINVFQNRYRINIYIETEEDNLMKKKIAASYFCHYYPGKLEIIEDIDKKPEDKKKKRSEAIPLKTIA